MHRYGRQIFPMFNGVREGSALSDEKIYQRNKKGN